MIQAGTMTIYRTNNLEFGYGVINDVPIMRREIPDDDSSKSNYGAHLPHQIPSTE